MKWIGLYAFIFGAMATQIYADEDCVDCGVEKLASLETVSGLPDVGGVVQAAVIPPESVKALCEDAMSLTVVNGLDGKQIPKVIAKFAKLAGTSHRTKGWEDITFKFVRENYHRVWCAGDEIISEKGELLRRMIYRQNNRAVEWFFGKEGVLIGKDNILRSEYNCIDHKDKKTLLEWLEMKKDEVLDESYKDNINNYIGILKNAGAKRSSELTNPKICGK